MKKKTNLSIEKMMKLTGTKTRYSSKSKIENLDFKHLFSTSNKQSNFYH